ncbi:MAG: flavodoxin family protein [Anaerolineae bacterium]
MQIAVIYHSETGNTRRMAELVQQGCERVPGVVARFMSVDAVDQDYVDGAAALILGAPIYGGSCSWQMKRFLDTGSRRTWAGKLGGVFVSQRYPAGGGESFGEMVIIAGMLSRGMMVYSGGVLGRPDGLHFGAVSVGAPEGIYGERCLRLGEAIATRAMELGLARQG